MPALVPERRRAVLALVLACAFWGLGFPTMKALAARAEVLAPGISTWCIASLTVGGRFLLGAAVLWLFQPVRPSAAEWRQGLWLGLSTGIGIVLQTDGMAYTEASTSAFLTQGYVLLLPVVASVRSRRPPPVRVTACVALAVTGLYVLSGFDPVTLSLGRGEAETLLAALCFTLQILVLDQRAFAENRTAPVTNVMFLTTAAIALPIALATARGPGDVAATLGSVPSLLLFLSLLLFSTLGAFVLMNRYQRVVSASEAGIVYGMEPVFASAFALFVPGWLSAFAAVSYANERLDARLLAGGGLVVGANLLLSLLERARERSRQSAST